MNLENTVKKASQKLKDNNIISYLLDAEIILADILGVERESLITNNKVNVSQKIVLKYTDRKKYYRITQKKYIRVKIILILHRILNL